MTFDKTLFIDVDGPLIPAKAQLLPGNAFGYWNWNFDPFAVRAINFLGWAIPELRLVLSSHRWGDTRLSVPYEGLDICSKTFWKLHFKKQGVKVPFHTDWITPRIVTAEGYNKRTKYVEIKEWLANHPEVKRFVTLEDDLNGGDRVSAAMRREMRLVAEDYDEGLTWSDFISMHVHLGLTPNRKRYMEYNQFEECVQ